jgi:uncharacterized membrane protein YjgN (DUF898 family)
MDIETSVPLVDPRSSGRRLSLSWLPPIGMVALSLVNFAYRILTLGIYDFWARTEVRKRIWAAIRLNGEPLVYTGTGKELFLGFLFAFGGVLLPLLLLAVTAPLILGNTAGTIINVVMYLLVFMLFGVAIYRAQRYRLLRTSWRGIRGNLEGSSWTYGLTYFWSMLLIPLTLGWIIPWRTTRLQSIITGDARLGDQPFSFKGGASPLYGPFALLWFGVMALLVGALVVVAGVIGSMQAAFGPEALDPDGDLRPELAQFLGFATLAIFATAYFLYVLLSAWYRARTFNHFADCTHFDNARFKGSATGLGLLWIDFTNLLIQLAGAVIVLTLALLLIGIGAGMFSSFVELTPETLSDPEAVAHIAGIAGPILAVIVALCFTLLLPVTQARSMGYLVEHLLIEGVVDVDKIAQGNAVAMSTGEGLAQAFDIDAF